MLGCARGCGGCCCCGCICGFGFEERSIATESAFCTPPEYVKIKLQKIEKEVS